MDIPRPPCACRAAGALPAGAVVFMLFVSSSAHAVDAGVPRTSEGPAKRAAASLADIDRLVAGAIGEGRLPGCVVAIGRKSGIVFEKAFGSRALLPEREPMTEDTLFDLASLTKPIATATALMILADQGKIDLDEKAAHYVPEFGARGKSAITLRQLLLHTSGLPKEIPVADFERGRRLAFSRIAALAPKAAPGERLVYSDVGYLVLEEVIRRVARTDLASLTASAVFRPLGMNDTGFLPAERDRVRAAPTEMRNNAWMRGSVHDPRAFRLGGVAGHAGLFSTAADLARYARMVLGGGELDGARILSPVALRNMRAPHDVPDGIRALGWDMQSAYSSNRGTAFSRRAVGHGGFTGTSLWIDPERDLFVIFLSNRVHPDGRGSVNTLAGAIATLAGTVLAPEARPAGASLATGIDVLVAENFARLRGLRVALLTNDSARTRDGRRTTDVLAARPDVKLAALLSPEHGLGASRDERIADAIDEKTRLPIFSLYGGRLGPRAARERGPRPVTLPPDLDALVVDLPDVGVRFFTYASTLHACMRAAAARGLRVLVLDRPNPINGVDVAGPVPKPRELSPVNHLALPVRHGMTMGELAEMMNADEHLGLGLEVVRMNGYDRRLYHDETGLAFRPPSPNLRTFEQTVLYPGIALLEATNLSVGRGTETPFEVLGATWIDSQALLAELARARLAGVVFKAATFTPKSNRFAGQACHGIRAQVSDRSAFEPVRAGIAIALALRKLFPDLWDASRLRRMLGDPAVAKAVEAGRPLPEIEALWRPALDAFKKKRAKYLLY